MSSYKCMQCGLVNWSTASSCKRCGGSLNGSGSVSQPGQSFSDTGYPKGSLPKATKHGDTVAPCLQCGKQLGLKKWDSWNGFLVQCPNCGGLHGKRWNIRRVLLASFVFSAISFFFTMRPAKAALVFAGFVVLAIAGSFLFENEQIPDIVEIILASILMLGPMLINAIVLIKHERDIDRF